MPQKPDLLYAIGLRPEKAVEYFASKGFRISWDWKDTWQEAHAKAFTVAKAMRMDVLQDLREGVQKAIESGITEKQFIDELTPKLQAKGWWGKKWTEDGEGNIQKVQLGSPRRLKNIYRTNLQSAYMAGRWKDMWENRDERPYWMFSSVVDANTRPTHRALNGLVFKADDPFWDTHYPPLDFGCRCRVRALSKERLEAKGLDVESSEGRLRDKQVLVSEDENEWKTVTAYTDPKTGVTTAPGPGFNFNQGKAAWQPDLEKYDYDVARQYLEGAVTGPDFTRFFKGDVGGNFPVAVMDKAYRESIDSKSQVVLLSDQTLSKNTAAHPEFALADYQQLPVLVEQAQLVVKDGDQTFVFLRVDDQYYFGAIKTTSNGTQNYLTSFRPARESDIGTIRKKGKVIKDEL